MTKLRLMDAVNLFFKIIKINQNDFLYHSVIQSCFVISHLHLV